ncbi:MAG: cytochrome c biogenesis protein CcsA [Bacteriovoracaceae bacterium]|nr:cytochrome c biogenesis protein CcsA [Bacteriovoracaceae bacterium]
MFRFLLIAMFSTALAAQVCDKSLESMPVQAGGRVKPLLVHANETIKFITGKSKFENKQALEVFCTLSLSSLGKGEALDLPIKVEHIDAKALMDMPEDSNFLLASSAINYKEKIRATLMKMKQTTPLKKELNKVWARINNYELIKNGQSWTVPLFAQDKVLWHGISDVAKDKPELKSWLEQQKAKYIEVENDSFLMELTYVKSHIFDIAMLLALLGIFATVLMKKASVGLFFGISIILVEIAGMTMRVLVSGRAPITNMYETVMFSGFGALVIALIVMIFKRDKIFLLAGLGYNVLCLFMMKFANNMLDPSISPLVPVLRDNFWLSTHVTTIILSYAALALSWILANIILVRNKFGKLSKADYRYYEQLIATSVKVGVVLLAAGIILGGVWADYSWGRFWGWDPKETWSLIVLLFYMAMLHGKYTNWVDTHRFVILSAAGFMTVMMAWFGVNYILATGLHSYGFSEGGAIFLGVFFLVQTLLIIVCGVSLKSFKSAKTNN